MKVFTPVQLQFFQEHPESAMPEDVGSLCEELLYLREMVDGSILIRSDGISTDTSSIRRMFEALEVSKAQELALKAEVETCHALFSATVGILRRLVEGLERGAVS